MDIINANRTREKEGDFAKKKMCTTNSNLKHLEIYMGKYKIQLLQHAFIGLPVKTSPLFSNHLSIPRFPINSYLTLSPHIHKDAAEGFIF